MKYDFLTKTRLFNGFTQEEIKIIIKDIAAKEKNYKKGEYIFHRGNITKEIGIVLSGSVNIEKDDMQGGHTIITNIPQGEIFAESYACAGEPLMINAVSAENSLIMFINTEYILNGIEHFHIKLVKNLTKAISEKNLNLTRKIDVITPKTIRERITTYLFEIYLKCGKNQFEIPFNRQQMADFLCVDRSAMSNELSKMQKEGIISFNKNKFTILNL